MSGGGERQPDGSSVPAHKPLGAKVEILKLAHLLGVAPEQLTYLEQVPPGDIRSLREQVTDLLFTAQASTLRRLAAASRLLPVGLVALIAERAFGAMLSARIAGLLDPGRAVEISDRLPIPFLADVAIELDPRRAKDVLSRIPPDRVAAVTGELVAREEWVTMGRFVGYLSTDSLQAAVGALRDEELLRTAFVMEDKERLDELAGILGEQRLEGLIDAAGEAGLWSEAIDLLANLCPERQSILITRALERGESTVNVFVEDELLLVALLDAVAESEAGVTLLRSLDDESKARLVEPVSRVDFQRRALILERAQSAGVADELGPLMGALGSGATP